MTKLFLWNGPYFGFLKNGRLFRADGEYLGWVDEKGRAWKADGTYLGELVQENYILRNTSKVEPMARIPRIAPISPVPPVPPLNRVGRVGKMSCIDALSKLY